MHATGGEDDLKPAEQVAHGSRGGGGLDQAEKPSASVNTGRRMPGTAVLSATDVIREAPTAPSVPASAAVAVRCRCPLLGVGTPAECRARKG